MTVTKFDGSFFKLRMRDVNGKSISVDWYTGEGLTYGHLWIGEREVAQVELDAPKAKELAIALLDFANHYEDAAKSERLAAMRECAGIICEGCNG